MSPVNAWTWWKQEGDHLYTRTAQYWHHIVKAPEPRRADRHLWDADPYLWDKATCNSQINLKRWSKSILMRQCGAFHEVNSQCTLGNYIILWKMYSTNGELFDNSICTSLWNLEFFRNTIATHIHWDVWRWQSGTNYHSSLVTQT